MLGREIVDAGTECAEGKYPGLGLLDGTTEFSAYRKHTVRVQRDASDIPPILAKMQEVSGYEIHMGETARGTDREALKGDGAVSGDGLVIGPTCTGSSRTRPPRTHLSRTSRREKEYLMILSRGEKCSILSTSSRKSSKRTWTWPRSHRSSCEIGFPRYSYGRDTVLFLEIPGF